MTRTGYHRGSGTETRAELGKWEHARDWVIGSFRQHTSRDGDPQLHVHNLVLNKVAHRAGRQVAQAGLPDAVPVPGRRRRDRRRGHRDGADQGLRGGVGAAGGRARPGDRRDQPGADGRVLLPAADHHRPARQVAAERERETGRRPDARQMYRIQKDIAYRTRRANPKRRWTSGPSCATGKPPPATTTSASWRRSPAPSPRRPGRQRERDRAGRQAESGAAGGAGDRVGARPAARPRAGRGGVPRASSGSPASSPCAAPIPGRWIRRCCCAGGRRRSAPTCRRSRAPARDRARAGPRRRAARARRSERARAVAYPVQPRRADRGAGPAADGRGDRRHARRAYRRGPRRT